MTYRHFPIRIVAEVYWSASPRVSASTGYPSPLGLQGCCTLVPTVLRSSHMRSPFLMWGHSVPTLFLMARGAVQVSVTGASAVADCLRAGLVPVLHGDAVLDEQLGCTILSGDTLVRDLAEQLRPQYVVFLTNVAGVYDRPPEEEGARLLRRIVVRRKDGSWRVTAADGGSEVDIRMTADTHDVTGGIALKVEEAARVARLGVPVLIAQAGSEDGAAACRLGPLVTVNHGIVPLASSEPQWSSGCLAATSDMAEQQQVNAEAGQQCATAWRGTLIVLEDDEGLENEALGGMGSAG
ncbi:hypothetical protein Vafri_18420 [Volvox africanus]|uniref:Aspartate/glutamate/uridylate kinase domain-containing protein n=1 Tax=Volvox africanus TaxID=51714 RepID=A0A8J4BM14_9CHLO|nr:hypothetical protein Vafri_18420 [Volvox africanus]